MRLVLLLHPDYFFPHSLESFPSDLYYYQWLDRHTNNRLVIIGNCRVIIPEHYAQSIICYPLSHTYRRSFYSSFRYRWKVFRALKKNNPDRILFQGADTFSFFLHNRFFSMLFHWFVRKKFITIQQPDVLTLLPAGIEPLINIPSMPSAAFFNRNEKMNDQLKEALTCGTEYFLCSASFTATHQLQFLLKAYSIFKQRLKTNFKLVLSGISHQDERFVTLLSNYKYRQDVIIPNDSQKISFIFLLSAAYLHIFPSFEIWYPCSTADCAASRVPTIYPEGKLISKDTSLGLTFAEGDVNDLSQKMMLVYKDETGRKKIIDNMYEHFRSRHDAFDFSSYL